MPDRSIRFYFDYISSNAYIAWAEIHKLAERHGCTVAPVPTLFAGLLNAHGQLGPAEVLVKSWWMCKNNLRKAALLGIPLHAPPVHPFNPLPALRISSLPMEDPVLKKLIDGLFAGQWARRLDIGDPEVVAAIATEAGLDGKRAVAESQAPAMKEKLRAQTDEAIAAGVFGVPTMVVDDELFWGYDDFPWLARYLAGDDPLDKSALAEWMGIKRGAERRRPAPDSPSGDRSL